MKLRYRFGVLAIMVAFLNGACATKRYVQKSLDPVNSKLGEVAQQTSQQAQAQDQTAKSLDQTKRDLDETKQGVAKNESTINATNERAVSADNRATDALNRANEASQKSDKLAADVGGLKTAIQNIDDYKAVSSTAVYFKFNSDVLDDAGKQQLDQLVAVQSQYNRYFVTVKGFTDQTGSSQVNDALSRRRAEAVVRYLVAERNVPMYKLQLVGLGKADLADEANTRAARAKNRRVEVSLFSADPAAIAREEAPSK